MGAGEKARSVTTIAQVIERIRAERQRLIAHGVAHMRLFGSIVRDDIRPDSDIDAMVTPDEHAHFSLPDLIDVSFILERALGRRVDVLTEKALSQAAFGKAAADEAVSVF